ncbi:MAG: HipA N-terminal domain-containing protein [Gammaproteobacteria bacterium]|nr:HipA N-terminal domain-containing protein [Gammaproteobacteria bacterium]
MLLFASAGIEVSPVTMPVREAPYVFPALRGEAFTRLPGLLADALPDRYGNALIDVWLAETGRVLEEFNPVDRLCWPGTGRRTSSGRDRWPTPMALRTGC